MTNLELNKFDVQKFNEKEVVAVEELTFSEMTEIAGGNWVKWITELATLYDAIIDGGKGFIDGAKQGYKDATK